MGKQKYFTEEERLAAQRASKKRWAENHRAAKREINKRWRERHKNDEEYKAKNKEQCKRYKEKNPQKIKEMQRLAYEKRKDNEEFKARCRENGKRFRENNPEYNKNWKEKHKTEMVEYNSNYYKSHKNEMSEWSTKYHSTQKGRAINLVNNYRYVDKKYKREECTLTAEWVIQNIFSKPCHYCGESDWTKIGCDRIDNTKSHTPDNVVPCCLECNLKRNNKTYDEFMRLIKKVG